MKSRLQILNEGFDRKYLSEAYNPEEYDDELILNADDMFLGSYDELDPEFDEEGNFINNRKNSIISGDPWEDPGFDEYDFDECLDEGVRGEAIGGAIGAYLGHPVLGAKAGSTIEDTAVKYAKDKFNQFKKDNNIDDDEEAYAELVKRGSKKAAQIGTKVGKKVGKAITNIPKFKRTRLAAATESLCNQIEECLLKLNEATVDPQTHADTEVLKSIQNKINGKKFNPKNFTPEEQDVLSRYGLDAWGFKGDTKMVTPGANDILSPNTYDWKTVDAFRKGKVNLADRARKIDRRARDYDIRNAWTRDYSPTYQDKNNAYVNHEMQKDYNRMKSALSDRRNAQQELDTGAKNRLDGQLADATSKYNQKVKEIEDNKAFYTRNRDYKQKDIDNLLARYRAKLSKNIGECLKRINEAPMSDQDKKDTEILRRIKNKLDTRRNARLTAEEQEVLDRLGLIRTEGGNWLGSSSNNRSLNMTDGRSTWDYRRNKRINRDDSKINLADRARKISQRDAYNRTTYDSLESERNFVNDDISKDTQKMKDYLYARNRYNDSLADQDKYMQDAEDKLIKDVMAANKRFGYDRSRARDRISNANSTIDDILASKKKHESYLKEDVEERSVVRTGLDSVVGADKAHDIIDSVLGQISDGYWENSPGQDKYWLFADANGPDIEVDRGWKNGNSNIYGKPLDSGFQNMNDAEVRKFFGNRIKTITQVFLNDHNLNPYKNWNENCEEVCTYLDRDSGVTVGDCYKAFKVLTGRG